MNQIEERVRDEVACGCGCGKNWLVSRGLVRHGDAIAAFVAIPTIHGEERVAWLAFGDRAEPTSWACARSWVNGDNIAAGIVDPDRSPFPHVLRNESLLPRERVVADQATKTRVFALHDALMREHSDLRHLFNPEHGRDFSFMMPDCVFKLPPAQRSPRNQQNFAECGERLFVRALLPIPVGDGTELRIGVWIEVAREKFFELLQVWDDEPAYAAIRVDGAIESSLMIEGHDMQGAHVEMAARDPSQCLFIRSSDEPWLSRLMREGVSVRVLPELVRPIAKA